MALNRHSDPSPDLFSLGGTTADRLPIALKFSIWPLLLVIVTKPVVDAFYELDVVKYVYMTALIVAVLFARFGESLEGKEWKANQHSSRLVWASTIYFIFLFVLGISYGGSLQEIFKIISPFAFLTLVLFAADRRMVAGLAVSATVVIVANAALLPTDYGWRYWFGGVNTFKGCYYFKTDLAYSLTFALLMLGMYFRFEIRPALMICIGLAATQIIFSNSRLNYLSLGLLLLFFAYKRGAKVASLSAYGLLILIVMGALVYVYQAEKLLGFNFESLTALTQGRDTTWTYIVDSMETSTLSQWLFGRGMYADIILSARMNNYLWGIDAHNELLHLVYTQGAIGFAGYVYLWVLSFRAAKTSPLPDHLKYVKSFAVGLFVLQGLTAGISSFATKTWPLVMILLMVRAMADEDAVRNGIPTRMLTA